MQKKDSCMKMEGDKNLRTLECLRGRLVAERQASKIAKEDSQRMENKLVELEKMVKQEIKLRNKAEKRLKFLKKKLESLNISSILVESDQSSSSEKSEDSSHINQNHESPTITCSSSSSSPKSAEFCSKSVDNYDDNSSSRDMSEKSEEVSEFGFNLTNSITSSSPKSAEFCRKSVDNDGDDNKSSRDMPETEFGSNVPNSITSSSSSSSSPKSAEFCRKSVDNDNDHDDDKSLSLSSTNMRSSHVGDSLALVPFNSAESSHELKPVHENVAQVLDSLRYIRETIQSSMEMRHMVRVGPT